ncbi:MAG: hypothetical protein IT168_23535 [Bryobacterales bacterium]|nr:hypothetical protein [Bryobacterales bacterium]
MHSAISLFLLAFVLQAAAPYYRIAGDQPGSWPRILESAGFLPNPQAPLVVLTGQAAETRDAATHLAAAGHTVILAGDSPAARSLGIQPADAPPQPIRSLVDETNPKLPIIWEKPVDQPPFQLPAIARVLARERWTSAPLIAAMPLTPGTVIWLATPPGDKGYERYPYLPQILTQLGIRSPLQSRHLWTFFDSSYRLRADPDYLAARWRRSGIAALHIAAWHYYDADPARDAWLDRLIEACHRRAILTYAWIELPHVSEAFWQQHPEWREKTAILQDAHLDWRRLMNLQNPACRDAVSKGLRRLITRFDWDGVNLAELYFESLEGHLNAARFTPMNDDVRAAFQAAANFDPHDLFDLASPRHHTRDPQALRLFLDWRASLAARMQTEWIAELESIRSTKPNLDLVLTHVDDRYDPRMRDLIGADAARLLPILDQHDITFLIEDPATIWHLGPERYTELAAKYEPLTKKPQRLAIDINIVDRYQDVYPTKQQTGSELFQLVHLASKAFARVALYFESSLLPPDLPLLPAAAAVPARYEQIGPKLVVDSPHGLGIPWQGAAKVNGQLWPFQDPHHLWLPKGAYAVEKSDESLPLTILDTSAQIRSVSSIPQGFEIAYNSTSRAYFLLDRPVAAALDGQPLPSTSTILTLPRGQHLLQLRGGAQLPTE